MPRSLEAPAPSLSFRKDFNALQKSIVYKGFRGHVFASAFLGSNRFASSSSLPLSLAL